MQATDVQKAASEATAKHLYQIIQPYLLQRKKADVVQILPSIRKVDTVIWTKLSSKQRLAYQTYINERYCNILFMI